MLALRLALAVLLSVGLAVHGYRKKSLDTSGAVAALIVGFVSFAVSYRFGWILIMFYYTSSKLTKVKEDVKKRLEAEYKEAGQRNYIQVFANSLLASVVAVYFWYHCGEDTHIVTFDPADQQRQLHAHLWCAYLAHYACANGDTWASELGILDKSSPRLVTSFFLQTVPPGTNGGMSRLGTLASALGGAFIGLVFFLMGFAVTSDGLQTNLQQWPIVVLGMVFGLVGSLVDSLLGATLQASYYSKDRKCIVKHASSKEDMSIVKICGFDLLSNEAVNFFSIGITMLLSGYISPLVLQICSQLLF